MSKKTALGMACLLLAAWLVEACSRDELPSVCTSMKAGALVISELRGPQLGTDTWGQWIEIFNATPGSVQLAGLVIKLRKHDGSGEKEIMIRDHDLVIAAAAYAVIGRFQRDDLPAHADYGYEESFPGDLYRDGILALFACDSLTDQVVYRDLPSAGTLAFDGSLTLSAEANDLEGNWCVDSAETGPQVGGAPQAGIPGTPGEENRPCN